MFGLFRRPSKAAAHAASRPHASHHAAVKAMLGKLLMQWDTTGKFCGAITDELPRMMTDDGIEVLCNPDLLIGLTVAPTAFGIEVANMGAQDMARVATAVLALQRQPDWMSDAQYHDGLTTHVRRPCGHALRLTCLPCPVDPCFNTQQHAGTRLIGHVPSARLALV